MALELPGSHRATGLVDVLDRVLDKGLVIAGDIKVSLAEVELLTIRIRLLVCSLDKAQEIGLDWWRYDRDLSPGAARAALERAAGPARRDPATDRTRGSADGRARVEAGARPAAAMIHRAIGGT